MNYFADFRSLLNKLDASASSKDRVGAAYFNRTLFKLEMLTYQASFVQETRQPSNSSIDWMVVADALRVIRKTGSAAAGAESILALQRRLHAFAAELDRAEYTFAGLVVTEIPAARIRLDRAGRGGMI
jgi:hypothetical protein